MSVDDKEIWKLSDAVKRLPRTVTPLKNETAESILWRLAMANGETSVRRLLWSAPNLTPDDVVKLKIVSRFAPIAARLAGVEEAIVRNATPLREPSSITLNGERFKRFHSIPECRVCLGCLRDDAQRMSDPVELRPYRRNWWAIPPISSCPEHALPLLDACPLCNSKLDPLHSPFRCRCSPGFDLREHDQVPIEPDALAYDQWLLGRLGVADRVPHPLLDTMSADGGARLCLMLGALLENKLLRTSELSFPQTNALAMRGWKILEDWPRNFEFMLDRLVLDHKAKDKTQKRMAMPYSLLNKALLLQQLPEEYSHFIAVATEHVLNNIAVTPRTRMFGSLLPPAKRVTIRSIQEGSDLGVWHLKAICDAEGIALDQKKPRNSLISIEDAAKIKRTASRVIPRHQVGKTLGCNYLVVRNLIATGIIKVSLDCGPNSLIDRRAVDKLDISERLDERYPQAGELAFADLSSVGRMSLHQLMAGYLNGMISPVCRLPGQHGWSGFCFEIAAAKRVCTVLRRKDTQIAVVKEYQWLSRTITNLRRMGYLGDALPGEKVDPKALANFTKRYVWMKEMLEWEGVPSRPEAIRRQLAACGVHPIFKRIELVTMFWPRRQAEKALRSSREISAGDAENSD